LIDLDIFSSSREKIRPDAGESQSSN